jgi:hypothetical protein
VVGAQGQMDEQLTREAVDNLVRQFSSALDFYRELVQNSIDAGTQSVEVWMEFVPGEHDEGTITIHVDDNGEGMDEAIIDGQLTRLFSSSKEHDLTKIGKFGIGFVSVFAMAPKAVMLHTGRAGESWEVFFHEDRSFTKTRIEQPVEGTQVTLFLAGDLGRYRELVRQSRSTISRWCSHSDTEVWFEDRSAPEGEERGREPINEPFVVAGELMQRVRSPGGGEIVVAFHDDPMCGFYNKGLALAVTRAGEMLLGEHAGQLRSVAFKIKSRYLEHTLSRETVMQDENYEKAMALLVGVVAGPLRSALVAGLEQLAAKPQWAGADDLRYRRYLRYLSLTPVDALPALAKRPILRAVQGGACSLDAALDAARRDGRLFVAGTASSVSDHLQHQGVPVLRGDADLGILLGRLITSFELYDRKYRHWLLRQILQWPWSAPQIEDPEQVMLAVDVDDDPPRRLARLVEAAGELLSEVDAGYRRLVVGSMLTPDESVPVFLIARKIAPVMALPPEGPYERGFLERPEALVNCDHPDVRRLVELSARCPALASYCLAKQLLLWEDRLLDRDVALMAAALSKEVSV